MVLVFGFLILPLTGWSADAPAGGDAKDATTNPVDSAKQGASPGIVDVWAGSITDRGKRYPVTLRDTICVQALNFDDWVASLNQINTLEALADSRAKPPKLEKLQRLKSLVGAAKGDVVIVVNGFVLEKFHPVQTPLAQDVDPNTFQTFVFKPSLVDLGDDVKRKEFLVALQRATKGKGDRVSIGLALPEPGTTHYRTLSPNMDPPVAPKALDKDHVTEVLFDLVNGWRQFGLLALVGVLAVGFFWLAVSTDVIRDPLAPSRPDGAKPFSLARAQMAFWFFLVLSSYLYLWLLTSSIDVLNKTALFLIGIPSLTALGAFAIDSGRSQGVNFTVLRARAEHSGPDAPSDLKTRLREQIIPAQRQRIRDVLGQRQQLLTARSSVPTGDNDALSASTRELDANQHELLRLQFELDSLEYDLIYLNRGPIAQLILDWLTENQSRTVSFHRFQMLAWTVVLAVIFVARVLDQLAMPEFSETVLGLMGISSGTYLGFRLPDQKPS